ncbi:AraC family transcriptional regulator [Sphingobacterium psychroaquaticum]|uniref:AraC family transcriptional regulator n=1 Tax=Sphingobacterium psychroaquaticum TaxID=561061 RepID=UPI00106B2F68|nr:AraC family transcriptional regulator [Sphingobacterium psychroaquaticum]QBQ41819.1 AraC family transcriptional regulator [Sphingobacterium psychroaquaticum]
MHIQRLNHIQEDQGAILIRHDRAPQNHNVWHYHDELEFIQITKGKGTFVAGDRIFKFSDGDSMLIGSNIPHYWLFDEEFLQTDAVAKVDIRVIHFKPDFMGNDFWSLKESSAIKQGYQRAKRILYFSEDDACIADFFRQLSPHSSFKQLLSLLDTLDYIGQKTDAQLLISESHSNFQQEEDYLRMNKILDYIRLNYKQKIQLQYVAQLAGLTENSFCRYFKQKTGKTLIQFINELRITHACKLLMEEKMAIKEVCFESGFQNFVSFHKTFKAIVGLTPVQYRVGG